MGIADVCKCGARACEEYESFDVDTQCEYGQVDRDNEVAGFEVLGTQMNTYVSVFRLFQMVDVFLFHHSWMAKATFLRGCCLKKNTNTRGAILEEEYNFVRG